MGLLGMTPSCPPLQLTYLPQPWGNCRAESGLREPELQGYSAYSVSACRLRCEKEAVLQRCHCRMVHMPGGHPAPRQHSMPPCQAPEPPGQSTAHVHGQAHVYRCSVHVSTPVSVWELMRVFSRVWNAHMCVRNMYLCMHVLMTLHLWGLCAWA